MLEHFQDFSFGEIKFQEALSFSSVASTEGMA